MRNIFEKERDDCTWMLTNIKGQVEFLLSQNLNKHCSHEHQILTKRKIYQINSRKTKVRE